jgi:hypothetical protein
MSENLPPTLETIYPNVDLKRFLKDHFDKHSLIDKTIQYIKLIPSFDKLKLDPELTLLILNIIKSEIPPGTLEKEKVVLELLLNILSQIYSLCELEVNVIKQQVVFLTNNNKVKGVSSYKKILKSSTRWLSRKLG